MTGAEMQVLKSNILRSELFRESSGKLWEAKRHLEGAHKENGQNFEKELAEARRMMADAEQIWAERAKL
jgi:hypothetical protein